MRIIVIAITLITLIAVVVVSIIYGTDLYIPGIKPTPTPTPTVVPTSTPATTPIVTDYISLIDNLREAGAIVVDTGGVIQQPCFSVDGKAITVNGSYVQVFEYEDATTADTEAALISPDGFSINHTFNNDGQICGYGWIAPPHFYKASNLIVLYIGENQAVIDVLETVLGSQFAGSVENDWQ
jgi:hypothetical protein